MAKGFRVLPGVPVTVRDDTVLATDLWLPEAVEQAPAILIRTPYDKSELKSDFIRPQQLVEAGFAVAVQDTRGRFASGGEWAPLMWDQEGRDGFDSVEWLATQPWCDGAVGMAGTSYCGIVQLAAAALEPPHLRAIAPAMAGLARFEREETGGAFWLDHLFGWLCFVALDWARSSGDPSLVSRVLSFLADPMTLRGHLPLEDAPLFALPGFPARFGDIAAGAVTPDLNPDAIHIPILSLGGWFDLYLRSSIGLFESRLENRHLVIGPWTHSNLLPAFQGQVHFGVTASGAAAGIAAQHIAFFDHYLRNCEAEIAPMRYFEMQGAGWRDGDCWPPSNGGSRALFPTGAGTLNETPASGTVKLSYSQTEPVPTLGGRLMPIGGLIPGPADQRPLERHRGVALFDTPPLEADTAVAGGVALSIELECDRSGIDLTAKLVDVAPDGEALFVTDAIIRIADLEPGVRRRVTLQLADTAWRFRAGQRLRLQLQTSNFPHFDRNPAAHEHALVTLHLESARLSLPLAE